VLDFRDSVVRSVALFDAIGTFGELVWRGGLR
jgi:hypothetical protein